MSDLRLDLTLAPTMCVQCSQHIQPGELAALDHDADELVCLTCAKEWLSGVADAPAGEVVA